MRERFQSLPRREQILLQVAAVLIVVYIVVGVIWQPLKSKETQLLQATTVNAETIAWMQPAVQQVKGLRGGSGSSVANSMSLSQMVDQAAARQGLRVTRFQPSGDNDAQVWFEKVDFNKVLAWLDQVENQYGLSVTNAAINTANTSGMVTVRVRLGKGG